MARPRTFDPDDVMKTALDIFWRNGFHGTSLDDITAATGLAKPSLYAAFGDKNALFLKIIDRYHDVVLQRSERLITSGPSAREAIQAWMESFLPHCSGAKGNRGCLSINTAMDGALEQAELRKSVKRFNTTLEKLVVTRLEADRAQFPKDFDPAAAARAIMAMYNGVMVLSRQTQSPDQVKAVITQTMKLLA
jgi:TetR/AcrR family transcriptional repressor of nem operon